MAVQGPRDTASTIRRENEMPMNLLAEQLADILTALRDTRAPKKAAEKRSFFRIGARYRIGIRSGMGGGGLFAFIRSLMDKPKIQADAAAAITNAATSHAESVDMRYDKLEKRLDETIALLDETRDQLETTDRRAAKADRKALRLDWYQQRTTRWHERHMPFDQIMTEIAHQLKPEMLEDPAVLDKIPPLEPFPHWDAGE